MSIFNDWFGGVDVWKLGTLWDYISYALIVLFGALVIWLAIRRVNYKRRPDVAAKRVAKRLRRLGGSGSKVYQNVTLRSASGDCAFEMLWMARDRLHPVKVLPRGTRVSGTATAPKWRIVTNEGAENIENPVLALQRQRTALIQLLTAKDFPDIEVEPLVVLADTYETPRFDIKGFSSVSAYQNLGAWRKKHPLVKKWYFDTAAVGRVLEEAIVPAAE